MNEDIIKKLQDQSEHIEAEADADFAEKNPGEKETVQHVYKYFAFEGCDNLIYAAGYMEGLAHAMLLLKK